MKSPHDPRCPHASQEVVGACEECGAKLERGDKYYRDRSGSLFCSTECAMSYYMIEEVEEA